MLALMTGNILQSDAAALVNTVNCEGFMGKGLAYQFKKEFPDTNKFYVEACRSGLLKPGKLHFHNEENKIIVNFPTKDKWREKSKIEYIESGMTELVKLVQEKQIHSIAIPPLGSGNGGLKWDDVKKVILKYIYPLSKDIDVYIYEPSLNYKNTAKKPPKLTLSHFILMSIKKNLTRFSKFRLQKTAFFLNLYSNEDFFRFDAHHFGPYSHAIDIVSRDIKEFQEYYGFDTEKALNYAYNTLISKKVEQRFKEYKKAIELSSQFINSYKTDSQIELYSTICFSIRSNKQNREDIVNYIHNWSKLKKQKFNKKTIEKGIEFLKNKHLIKENILGELDIAYA